MVCVCVCVCVMNGERNWEVTEAQCNVLDSQSMDQSDMLPPCKPRCHVTSHDIS